MDGDSSSNIAISVWDLGFESAAEATSLRSLVDRGKNNRVNSLAVCTVSLWISGKMFARTRSQGIGVCAISGYGCELRYLIVHIAGFFV